MESFMEVAVEILQEEIDDGQPCQEESCPVALALRRLYPEQSMYLVGPFDSAWDSYVIQVGEEKFRAGKDMLEFINRFDGDEPVSPVTVHMTRA